MEKDRVRGVLFDAGNTLIRVRGSVGDVYAGVARRHGLEVDGEALDARFRQRYLELREGFVGAVSNPHSAEREKAWWRGLVRDVFAASAEWSESEKGFDAFFDDLYDEFARPGHWEVFEDVGPVLDALEDRGVPFGVVSNWDSRLHATLEGLGIRDRFRFVITSAEFGAEKPGPEIFWEGARRLGMSPGEVLYVGDLVRDDLLGSREAGLRGVLVDRRGTAPEHLRRVTDLREILDWVDGARRTRSLG